MASSASKLHISQFPTFLPAVKLHRRELEVVGNIGVLDGQSLLQRLSLHPFTSNRAGGNGRATAEGLELGIHNLSIGNLNLDRITTSERRPYLKLHHITAGRSSCNSRTHILVVLIEGTYGVTT